jgi:hypothetical protein
MLGGRAYRSAAQQPTFAQSGYLRGLLLTHGLYPVIESGGDVLAAIYTAGCESALIAGLIVEDGRSWSREAAAKNAQFFEGLTDAAEHAQLDDALALLLSNFTTPKGISNEASPTFSADTPKGKRKTRRRRAETPPSAAGSGSMSSPVSPTSTASA